MNDRERERVEREGGERGEGRPAGVTDSARSGAEGRPSTVRQPDAMTKPDSDAPPTESDVERGETPSTEHHPGGDL
jgi:hypothetical protein